jgi:hypothetical protein
MNANGSGLGPVIGPDMVVPGSEQLAPVLTGSLAALVVAASVVGAVVRVRRERRGDHRRPVGLVAAGGALVALVGLTVAFMPPAFFVPEFPPLPELVPADNVFERTVADLPVAPDSERWVAALQRAGIIAGFSGRVVDGVVWGMPFNPVDPTTPRRDVRIVQAPDTSFPGPFPVSEPAYVESMPTYGVDNHYIGIDARSGEVWELIAIRSWFGRWEADAGAHWLMGSNDYPSGSTIATGLPLLPGTITYDEVAAGRITHVVLAGTPISSPAHIWPALSSDGPSRDPDAPPQGAWMRLRADVDLSALGPQARIIATALREYGTILSDTAGRFGFRGTPDARWDDADLDTLATLTTDDFEFVDPAGIVVASDSLAVRPPTATSTAGQ